MKKVASMILVMLLCVTLLPIIGVTATEAVITNPSADDWIDAWNNDIVIKWTSAGSGATYRISIVDTGNDTVIVRNQDVKGTTFTIPKKTLNFWTDVKVWVGTFVNGEQIGAGDDITFHTIPAHECVKQAAIISPSDRAWVDSTNPITIKLSNVASDLCYKISIVDDVTGTYVANNEIVSGTSYIIPRNTLEFEHRYKIWVGTFYKLSGQSDWACAGDGSIIYMHVNAAEYGPAKITKPLDGTVLDTDSDLLIQWEGHPDLAYWLSVNDTTDNRKILDEKGSISSSYKIEKAKLVSGHTYKIWLGSYRENSAEQQTLGDGDTIHVSVAEKNYTAATLTNPTDGEEVSGEDGLTVRWSPKDAALAYYLVITNIATGETVDVYKTQNDSYTFASRDLEDGKSYQLTLTTYIPDAGDWIGGSKPINGKILMEDSCVFTVKNPQYAKVLSCSAAQNDDIIEVFYSLDEGIFTHVNVSLQNSNGEEIMHSKNHTEREEFVTFRPDAEMETGTYTCVITVQRKKGYTYEDSCEVTYTKPEAERPTEEPKEPENPEESEDPAPAEDLVIKSYSVRVDERKGVMVSYSIEGDNFQKVKFTVKDANGKTWNTATAAVKRSDFSVTSTDNMESGDYSCTIELINTDMEVVDRQTKQFRIDKEEAPVSPTPGRTSDWALEDVKEAYKKELVPEEIYTKDLTREVSRAEFAAIAVKLYEALSGSSVQAGNAGFEDIRRNSLKDYIEKAYAVGITDGTSAQPKLFSPDTDITREQLATMLTRVYKKYSDRSWRLDEDDFYLNVRYGSLFADDEDVSAYAKESVYFMRENKIVEGMGANRFAPRFTATREQAIVMALRMLHAFGEGANVETEPKEEPTDDPDLEEELTDAVLVKVYEELSQLTKSEAEACASYIRNCLEAGYETEKPSEILAISKKYGGGFLEELSDVYQKCKKIK